MSDCRRSACVYGSVDGSGNITLTQLLAVEHPTPGASHDELSAFLTAGVLTLTVTVTDNDGDTVSRHVDLGRGSRLEDDGPTVTLTPVGGATLVIEQTDGVIRATRLTRLAAILGSRTVAGPLAVHGRRRAVRTALSGGFAVYALSITAKGVPSGLLYSVTTSRLFW